MLPLKKKEENHERNWWFIGNQYVDCNNNSEKKFNENLGKKFKNTYKFCDGNISKFCLMLQIGVCPYEYLDSWQRFNKKSLQDKTVFYNNLIIKNISRCYKHAKRVWEDFRI